MILYIYYVLVVLDFSLLKALIHASLNLFTKSVHLIGLLLYQSSFSRNYLLVSLLHVSFTFLFFHLLRLDLNLMSLSILFLAGELALNGLQV